MNRITILAVGFFVLFVGGGARFAIGLALKPMAEELEGGRASLGLAVAAYLIVTSGSMFIAGRLADELSTRAILASGLIISAVGMGLMGVLSTPWQVLAAFGVIFAIGNGVASITPVSLMVSRVFPSKAGLANGVVSAGMSAGQLLIIGALAVVLARSGWRAVFLWGAAAHVLLLPFVVWAVPSITSGPSQPSDQGVLAMASAGVPLRAAAGRHQFWLLIAVYAMCGFDDFFVSTHVVAFAQDRGVEALLAGHLLALMGLVGFAGVILAGAWSDRAGPVVPAVASFFLRITAFAVIMLDQSPAAVAAFALLFGFTFLMTAPLLVIFVREAFGMVNLGAITGLIVMIHHMCGGVGAWIGAAIFDTYGGYDAAFALMLASSLLAAFLSAALGRGSRR